MEIDQVESMSNKKYKCLDNGFDTIYSNGEDDRSKELLDPSHTPEEEEEEEEDEDEEKEEEEEEGNTFIFEESHGHMNFENSKNTDYGLNINKKQNEGTVETRNLMMSNEMINNGNHTKGKIYNTVEQDGNVAIEVGNIGNEKECSEIHYHFGNKYVNDKEYEPNLLDEFTETNNFISSRRSRFTSKLLIGGKVALIILLCLFAIFIFTKFKKFLLFLQIIISWVGRQGSWSILLFICLFTFTAPLFMSVEIMCIGSGLIFCGVYGKLLGLFVAVLCVFTGYILGMSLCFFISRYLIHNYVYKKLINYPIYMAFNQAIDTNGLSFVLLIRLSPVLPASMVSYMLGVTSLKYKDFALGSISALPSIFLFTYIGALLQDFSNISELESHWGNIVILLIGFVIGIGAIVYITVVTKRRLNNMNIMNSVLTSTDADVE